jgi:lysine decarboxylase
MRKAVGHERLFIIDEAHGAHLYFNDLESHNAALKAGADAAVTSIHKMLGSIYGTALLNVSKDTTLLDLSKIKSKHLMFAGDLPSPFLLGDLEGCVKDFVKNGNDMI